MGEAGGTSFMLLGETSGVLEELEAEAGLVHTVIGAPGLANRFSRCEVGVWPWSWGGGRGGRDLGPPKGAGEGRKDPWGRAEWNLARAAGGVKESTAALGKGPEDSRRSPKFSPGDRGRDSVGEGDGGWPPV